MDTAKERQTCELHCIDLVNVSILQMGTLKVGNFIPFSLHHAELIQIQTQALCITLLKIPTVSWATHQRKRIQHPPPLLPHLGSLGGGGALVFWCLIEVFPIVTAF